MAATAASAVADPERRNGAAHARGAELTAPDSPPLPFAAAALLKEYEAWLGEWDEACKRAAMGGAYALDTIYAFARLRTTFPFAPDIMDDVTLDALCALPWDAHHRALLGLDPTLDKARIRDDAERRIGQACAILGDAALAVPAEGDYHTRLLWLQRIATAQGKAALDALLAALLAPPGQPLLSAATTQNRHGAAAVLGRLCDRARLPVTGPMGGALAALDERHRDVVNARPVLVHGHAAEQPQADWLLPLAVDWTAVDAAGGFEDEPPGAPHGRRLRTLSETVRRVEEWYTSVAASLRAVAAERLTHTPRQPAAFAALADRRVAEPSHGEGRTREVISTQRATTTVEHVRARAQLMRDQLRDAAAQIEHADSTTWMQVVTTAQQLERWLATVARGWVEADPSVTPLIREIRAQAAHIAALTTPPVKVLPVESVEAVPLEAVPLEASPAPEGEPATETVTPLEEPAPLPMSEAVPEPAIAEPEAYELPDLPALAEPVKPKRRRTRKKPEPVAETAEPAPPRRARKRKAPAQPAPEPEPEPEPAPASEQSPEPAAADEMAPSLSRTSESVTEPLAEPTPEPEPEPESKPQSESMAELAPEPEPEPPPPVDWTPQLKGIEALGAQWAQRTHKRSRSANDSEREQLIGQLNELVWPIVSGGIDPYSDAARTIRQTLEPIVNEANRFADRQHSLAMSAFRQSATQANTFGARNALREAMQVVEAGLEYKVPDCPGPFKDVRDEYDATRNRLMLLRNYIAVKL